MIEKFNKSSIDPCNNHYARGGMEGEWRTDNYTHCWITGNNDHSEKWCSHCLVNYYPKDDYENDK